jgi:hypothetical protein
VSAAWSGSSDGVRKGRRETTTELAFDRMSLVGFGRPMRGPTPAQADALRELGVPASSFRLAAHGRDVFAYLEEAHSTRRVQIAPDGRVVDQAVLEREPRREAG